jgi:hypothetical protein
MMSSPDKGRFRLFQASKSLRAIGSLAYLKLNEQLCRLIKPQQAVLAQDTRVLLIDIPMGSTMEFKQMTNYFS